MSTVAGIGKDFRRTSEHAPISRTMQRIIRILRVRTAGAHGADALGCDAVACDRSCRA